jgi:hypothetical protein
VRLSQPIGNCDGRDDTVVGNQCLFVVFDQDTRLVPTYAIGKRTTAVTEAFMLDLASRANRCPTNRPQISTDGFAAHPAAVDLAFAQQAYFSILIEDYSQSEQPGCYGAPDMVSADRRPLWEIDTPYVIYTSRVERNNLAIRTFMKRFTRLSLDFSKKFDNLSAAVALHTAYYDFWWKHGSLRMSPAMAANVATELWDLGSILTSIQL